MEKSPSEIVKLTERISKDPKSKLFVPLAEEYKKIGDIEMAIHVLSEGLKQNPTYVTARSLLGRLLFENGDLVAAQKEFEEVVKAIPDNLRGRKKLGDLYLRQNKKEEALQQYTIALNLNPGDKPFAKQVAELSEQVLASTTPVQKAEIKPQTAVAEGQREKQKAADQEISPSATAAQVPQTPETSAGETQAPTTESRIEPLEPVVEVASKVPGTTAQHIRADEISKTTVPVGGPSGEEKAAEPGLFAESGREGAPPSVFETEEPEEVLTFEPLDEDKPDEPESVSSPGKQKEFLAETAPSAGSIFEESTDRVEAIGTQTSGVEDLQKEEAVSDLEIVSAEELDLFDEESRTTAETLKEGLSSIPEETAIPTAAENPFLDLQENTGQAPEKEKPSEQSDDFTTDTLAELYIAQGFFEKAIDIYQRMVADHPESIGLQNKLARVKAMASDAEKTIAPAGILPEPLDEPVVAPVSAEAREYIAPVEERTESLDDLLTIPEAMDQNESFSSSVVEKPERTVAPLSEDEEITIDAEILMEPDAVVSESGVESGKQEAPLFAGTGSVSPSSSEEPAPDIFTTPDDESLGESKPAYRDFEPKEYIPPDASLHVAKKVSMPAESGYEHLGKRETIDRLEKWLTTIKKEK